MQKLMYGMHRQFIIVKILFLGMYVYSYSANIIEQYCSWKYYTM